MGGPGKTTGPPRPAAAGAGLAGRAREVSADTRALAVLLCLAWATMFIVQRLAVRVAPPLWVGALRIVVAAVVLLPLAGSLRGVGRRDLVAIVALGVANQAAFIGLQVAGLRTVQAGPAAAIVYLQPVLVVLASHHVLGERLTAGRLAAVLLGFTGVAVIGVHQATAASVAGVLLLTGAAVAWTVGTLVTSASRTPIMPLVVGQHLVGAPLLGAVAAVAEPLPRLSAQLVVCVAIAGVFGSALGWTILGTLLRRGDAGTVSTWLFAVPVLAAVLGVVLLGEAPSLTLVAGIGLVAVAVRLASSPGPRGSRRAADR